MSDFKRSERGVVMVVALLITTLLFLMAITISYTLSSYFKSLAVIKEKTQTYYTAASAAEQIRDVLWRNGCQPPLWCGRLGAYSSGIPPTPQPNNTDYQDITSYVTGTSLPTFGYTQTRYQIFLKDDDDDNDYNNDEDAIVLAIIKATGDNGATTVIEASFLFAGGETYKQFGQNARRTGSSSERTSTSDATTVNQTINTN